MGDVITAMEFMLTLVGETIITLYVLTYAMHCLLVVARDTATGQDEVVWPSEPFLDWIGGALHLVAVVLIWLAPVGVLARALRQTWLAGDDALRFLLLAVPGLWLLFPVALLSSLSGSSRWFVFRPVVVWNLLRVAPSTLAVYAISALLAAVVAALGYAAVVSRWHVLVPVAAAAAAGAFLIYARLLGRLAWKIGRLPTGKRKAAKKVRPPAGRVEANDPWAAPVEEKKPDPEPEVETTAYGRKKRRTKGYGLAPEEPSPRPEIAPLDGYPPIGEEPQPSDFDRRIHQRPKRPDVPKRLLLGGVFTFPGYAQSRKAWLLLALGFLVVGAGASALVFLYAALFKDT